jgi:LCP family protein required for cell wall assembly
VSNVEGRDPDRSRPGQLTLGFLSFLWPGLGHAALRLRRAALILAVPTVILLGLWILLYAQRGTAGFAISLISPTVAWSLMATFIAIGVWRLIAVADAARRGTPPAPDRRAVTGIGLGAIVVAIVAPHAIGAFYAYELYDTWTAVYQPTPVTAADGSPAPHESLAPGESPPPVASLGPIVTPSPSGRFTVLITGIDSSATRNHALNDTLIVASIDPTTGKVAMVSFPRDLAGFKLYDGGTYPDRINSLMGWSQQNPKRYPDGGLPTVARELGYLLGIPIPYYASVDLQGFSQMIDAVGGVTVNNLKAIDDPGYGGWTDKRPIGFHLSAGPHTLDGQTALAYVRSRKGVGDSDFTRARRQQQLLVALGKKLSDPAMLGRLPAVLSAARTTIQTNVPPDLLQTLLDLGQKVQNNTVQSYVLGPPYAERIPNSSAYLLGLDDARVRKLSVGLFGADSRFAAAEGG